MSDTARRGFPERGSSHFHAELGLASQPWGHGVRLKGASESLKGFHGDREATCYKDRPLAVARRGRRGSAPSRAGTSCKALIQALSAGTPDFRAAMNEYPVQASPSPS